MLRDFSPPVFVKNCDLVVSKDEVSTAGSNHHSLNIDSGNLFLSFSDDINIDFQEMFPVAPPFCYQPVSRIWR